VRVTSIRYRDATRPPQSRWRRDRVFPSRRKRSAVVLLVKSQCVSVIVSAHARRRQMKRRARGLRTAGSSARRPRASYYASGAGRETARPASFLVVVRDPLALLLRLALVALPWCRVLCRAAPWRIDQVSSRIVVDGAESMCPGALDPQDAGVRVIKLAITLSLCGIAYHPAPSQSDLVPHLCGAIPSDVLTLKSGSVPVV